MGHKLTCLNPGPGLKDVDWQDPASSSEPHPGPHVRDFVLYFEYT